MATLLEVCDVYKAFGGVRALNGVSLKIADDRPFWGLIGPNGSGKTTLFNVASGVYQLDQGTVTFAGRALQGSKPWTINEAGLGRTFQIPRLFQGLTVEENLLVGSSALGRHARARAIELLTLFRLQTLAHRRADRLSIGQQKLVELARVLMRPRPLVLLDEVCAGINPELITTIGEYLREIARGGVCFFIIEHNMSFLMNICSYIYVLSEGQLIAQGAPGEVQTNERVVHAYLGGQPA